jgi:hypothetical protein
MMKITNRGDIIRHVVQPAEDADAPEFSNLNTFYVVLGAISPLATGSITGFPTIAEAEIMASTSFLSFYGETPLRTDGGTIINGSADYVTFSQDAIGDNHPIKKHAEVLKQIIQSGKLDSKIIALSTLSSATAIRKFFSGFQLVQETNNLTPAELQALLLEGAVTPVITAITPTSVQLDDIATTQFTITGKQFTNTGGTLTATLGETSGTIISTSDTEVVLTFENADEAGTFSLTINREVTANTTNNLDDTASVATVADTKITIIE